MTARYVVLRTGPKCWYAMDTVTRSIGVGFRTKRQAKQVCDEKNARPSGNQT